MNANNYSSDETLEFKQFLKSESNVLNSGRPTVHSEENIEQQVLAHNGNQVADLLAELRQQLSDEETQKREFKSELLHYIQRVILIQFAVMGFVIVCIVLNICIDIPFTRILSENTIKTLLKFFEFCTGTITAEFVAMLAIIVRFAFDKSVTRLITNILSKFTGKQK